jgi:hypothetical protein
MINNYAYTDDSTCGDIVLEYWRLHERTYGEKIETAGYLSIQANGVEQVRPDGSYPIGVLARN